MRISWLSPRAMVATAAFWMGTLCVEGSDWPAFRGPTGNGVTEGKQPPIEWSATNRLRWKFPLPGPGNSSPIVSRGHVFVTCAEQEGRKRNLYCLDRRTGALRWVRTVGYTNSEPTHRTNPYCASTPVADGTNVVVWHGSAGVFCYNFEGHQLWVTELGPMRHEWGYASSPILHDGKVILNFGPGARTFLVALDLSSGRPRWKHEEPGGLDTTEKRMVGSWSTPIVVRVGGREEIVCSMPTRVIACAPETGSLVWSCDGLSDDKADLVYASPLVAGGIGVAFTGWINGPTVGFKLDGTGNVTTSNRLWRMPQTQRIGSGVAVGGHIYMVNAGPGTVQCMEALTGNILWTERLEGGESWGSLVQAGDRFYVTSRRGITTVFRANPTKLEVLAMNDLGESSHATPAISDGEIFLRTDRHVYCIGEN
jgi:outer membrane protein assembly factor BamB